MYFSLVVVIPIEMAKRCIEVIVWVCSCCFVCLSLFVVSLFVELTLFRLQLLWCPINRQSVAAIDKVVGSVMIKVIGIVTLLRSICIDDLVTSNLNMLFVTSFDFIPHSITRHL
jgi:hypothetical protein